MTHTYNQLVRIFLTETAHPNEYIDVYAVQPKEWTSGGYRIWQEAYDAVWTGREDVIRIETDRPIITSIAIAIKPIIGRDGEIKKSTNRYTGITEVKIKIEFIRDGEDSEFSTGIAYCE